MLWDRDVASEDVSDPAAGRIGSKHEQKAGPVKHFQILMVLCCVCVAVPPRTVSAQLRPSSLRLSVDADVLAVGFTKVMPDDGRPVRRHTSVGVGPSQLGASQLGLPTATLGVGAGYALHARWLLGLRAGFGYDHVSAADAEPAASYLTWTFMPGITYVPYKTLFVVFSPLLEYTRRARADARQTRFGGCFSAGAGSFLFFAPQASLDLGVYFEGRFPDIDERPARKTEITDLRWVLRAGFSVWR